MEVLNLQHLALHERLAVAPLLAHVDERASACWRRRTERRASWLGECLGAWAACRRTQVSK